MPQHTVLSSIASRIETIRNLDRHNTHNPEVRDRNEDEILRIIRTFMPHGSGFDVGLELDFDRSTESKLIFKTSFHHMSETGMYDGWTDHVVTFEATFTTPNVKVSGRNRNDIKDYIADTFMGHGQQLIEAVWQERDRCFLFYGPMNMVA